MLMDSTWLKECIENSGWLRIWFIRWLSLENNLSVSSLGPQSPLDMKPDTASLLSPGSFSPTGGGGPNSPGMGHGNLLGNSTGSNSKGSTSSPYPPNHPLSNSKHLCSICGDRASGKHYGVYSSQSKTERKHFPFFNMFYQRGWLSVGGINWHSRL
ncbi:unnamed protein product [Timema podura]|uniref:Nuclear receptor domain-containing protein n=1 Tax=Timema podura TaxID=61482 RepID=A0ABN7P021_TIMPD|nr:unnamed protein product [Timema podura]